MDIFSRQKVFTPMKLLVMGILFAGFLLVTVLVAIGKTGGFDKSLITFAFGLHAKALNYIMIAITHLADTKVLGVFCIILMLLPWRFRFGLPVAAATVVGGVTHKLIKLLVDRPRPGTMDMFITVDGTSFPSGHSNGGLIFYILIAILVGRMLVMQNNRTAALALRIGLGVLVFLIGFSRIYLGVHYPSDVLGGWLLGSLLTIFFLTLYDHFWPKKFRISYEIPNWDPIPRDSEKRKGWKKPSKKVEDRDRLDFPKKTGDWKYPDGRSKRKREEIQEPQQRTRQPLYENPFDEAPAGEEVPVFEDRPERPVTPPRVKSGGKRRPRTQPPSKPPSRPPRRPLV